MVNGGEDEAMEPPLPKLVDLASNPPNTLETTKDVVFQDPKST